MNKHDEAANHFAIAAGLTLLISAVMLAWLQFTPPDAPLHAQEEEDDEEVVNTYIGVIASISRVGSNSVRVYYDYELDAPSYYKIQLYRSSTSNGSFSSHGSAKYDYSLSGSMLFTGLSTGYWYKATVWGCEIGCDESDTTGAVNLPAPTPTPTDTPVVATPTDTPVVATPTDTPVVATPTDTPVVATPTDTPVVVTPTWTAMATATATASLSPNPATVDVQTDDKWHEFTLSSSESVKVVANPDNTWLNVEIYTSDVNGRLCPGDRADTVTRSNGQTIQVKGCYAGIGTVELRRASDDSLLRTYTFTITTPPPPPPTPTWTPTPTPTPTPPPSISIAKVIPGTTSVFVKLAWSPKPPGNLAKLTLKWDQTSGTKCSFPRLSCRGSAELSTSDPADVTHTVKESFVVDSDYTFSVTAKIKGDEQDHTTKNDLSGIVNTHPLPAPVVTHVYGDGRTPVALHKFNGLLMWPATVWLGVTARATSHKFALEAPPGAGMEAKTADLGLCSWQNASTTTTPWQASNNYFYLVRCGVGTGAASVKITAQAVDGGADYDLGTYATLLIPQSWHQADHVVQYSIDTLPPTWTPTVTPTITPTPTPFIGPTAPTPVHTATPTPTATPNYQMAIATAAAAWNSAAVSISFCEDGASACNSANKDRKSVTIKYVTPRPTPVLVVTTPTPSTERCGLRALACVDDGRWYGIAHIANQTMYILQPLHYHEWELDAMGKRVIAYKEHYWTDDLSVASDPNRPEYYYLPGVLMHEFGHTAGLGHGRAASDVMFAGVKAQSRLTYSDKKAMERNYDGHSKH